MICLLELPNDPTLFENPEFKPVEVNESKVLECQH